MNDILQRKTILTWVQRNAVFLIRNFHLRAKEFCQVFSFPISKNLSINKACFPLIRPFIWKISLIRLDYNSSSLSEYFELSVKWIPFCQTLKSLCKRKTSTIKYKRHRNSFPFVNVSHYNPLTIQKHMFQGKSCAKHQLSFQELHTTERY